MNVPGTNTELANLLYHGLRQGTQPNYLGSAITLDE